MISVYNNIVTPFVNDGNMKIKILRLLVAMQKIDRRVLYLIVAIVISVPLVIKPNYHPDNVFKEVTDAYNVVEGMPNDKVAFLSTIWSGSTAAENSEQTAVIIKHLFKNNKRFVIVSWDQAGNKLSYDLAKSISDQYGKTYGKDWVHLGYRIPNLQTILRGFGTDFIGTFKTDYFNKPLGEIPLTKNIKNAQDFGFVADITPSATLEAWIAYFCEPYKVKLVYCPAAVLAASAYPFLDTGQVAGMLNGVIGAAQYETLIGDDKKPTKAGAMSLSLSLAHIFILLLILTGNLAYYLEKKLRMSK